MHEISSLVLLALYNLKEESQRHGGQLGRDGLAGARIRIAGQSAFLGRGRMRLQCTLDVSSFRPLAYGLDFPRLFPSSLLPPFLARSAAPCALRHG